MVGLPRAGTPERTRDPRRPNPSVRLSFSFARDRADGRPGGIRVRPLLPGAEDAPAGRARLPILERILPNHPERASASVCLFLPLYRIATIADYGTAQRERRSPKGNLAMCGIAGAVDLNGSREFSGRRLLAMTGSIAHRGPDDERIHIEPGVALGARRLSVVDLENGRQPIDNEDGTVWVAYNGELYQYPEVRKDLLARGHTLKTRCDTEAWVHLYEDHGEGMFERARGDFAVAVWDRKSRTLAARPRPQRRLPALLRRARRLAPVRLGGQGPARLGPGRERARPEGHRLLLQLLLAPAPRGRSSRG